MPHKLFEGEVSRTLRALGPRCFYLKPLDGVLWAAERVDFHCVIDGRGVNIEAKETTSETRFNLSGVSANQLNCLRATEQAGGLGLLLVNFSRKRIPGKPGRGVVAVYRSSDLSGKLFITPAEAFQVETPIGGGTWTTVALDRLLSRGKPIYRNRQHYDESAYVDGDHVIRREGEA